jgi:hypothetical protein
VYENLVRDTEADPKNREEAARDWRNLCRRRVAQEVAKNARTPVGEHWKVVLRVIHSAKPIADLLKRWGKEAARNFGTPRQSNWPGVLAITGSQA